MLLSIQAESKKGKESNPGCWLNWVASVLNTELHLPSQLQSSRCSPPGVHSAQAVLSYCSLIPAWQITEKGERIGNLNPGNCLKPCFRDQAHVVIKVVLIQGLAVLLIPTTKLLKEVEKAESKSEKPLNLTSALTTGPSYHPPSSSFSLLLL